MKKLTELQQFINNLPTKYTRKYVEADIIEYKMPFTSEVSLRAYSEHDALHFLGSQPFTKEGEECVSFLEKKFQRGWTPLGKRYNPYYQVPCECDTITQELIDEVAQVIYKTYKTY